MLITKLTRKPRLYHPYPIAIGDQIILSPQAAQHITRVLRMKVGEEVILFNNQGGEYNGIIKQIKNKTEIYIQEYCDNSRESPLKIHLGQSLVRHDRMDFIIQKATELGVHEITPLITALSIIKLEGKSLEKKYQHWFNIIVSAGQQCGRTQLPVLNAPLLFQTFVSLPFDGAQIGFDLNSKLSLKSLSPTPNALRILLGPESGFDKAEIALAMHHQFKFYTLGPRTLRAETASIAAVSALQLLYGDLS